jgi:ATP-dependent exoDNAse (exonuclease V) alpha subunit
MSSLKGRGASMRAGRAADLVIAATAELHGLTLLAPEQEEAVRLALTSRVAVLTGGPGCGKSFTVRSVVALVLYTGVTPAKKLVVLAGSRRALAVAVRSKGSGRRHTALAHRLSRRSLSAPRRPQAPRGRRSCTR